MASVRRLPEEFLEEEGFEVEGIEPMQLFEREDVAIFGTIIIIGTVVFMFVTMTDELQAEIFRAWGEAFEGQTIALAVYVIDCLGFGTGFGLVLGGIKFRYTPYFIVGLIALLLGCGYVFLP